jgi:hypothetical protein
LLAQFMEWVAGPRVPGSPPPQVSPRADSGAAGRGGWGAAAAVAGGAAAAAAEEPSTDAASDGGDSSQVRRGTSSGGPGSGSPRRDEVSAHNACAQAYPLRTHCFRRAHAVMKGGTANLTPVGQSLLIFSL